MGDQGTVGNSDDLCGEIHLIQLELGGGERGAEAEGQNGMGDIVGERRGREERGPNGPQYLEDKDCALRRESTLVKEGDC